jgi:hypothetical protein
VICEDSRENDAKNTIELAMANMATMSLAGKTARCKRLWINAALETPVLD